MLKSRVTHAERLLNLKIDFKRFKFSQLTSSFPLVISFERGPGCFPLQTMIGSRKDGEPIIRTSVFRFKSSLNNHTNSTVNQGSRNLY